VRKIHSICHFCCLFRDDVATTPVFPAIGTISRKGKDLKLVKLPPLTDEQMFDPAFDAVVRADYNNDLPRLIEFVRSSVTQS
jgi:hypothetical protein